ncbi:hypothetical protein ACFL51_00695, partial [Myxococcota bacterium]
MTPIPTSTLPQLPYCPPSQPDRGDARPLQAEHHGTDEAGQGVQHLSAEEEDDPGQGTDDGEDDIERAPGHESDDTTTLDQAGCRADDRPMLSEEERERLLAVQTKALERAEQILDAC